MKIFHLAICVIPMNGEQFFSHFYISPSNSSFSIREQMDILVTEMIAWLKNGRLEQEKKGGWWPKNGPYEQRSTSSIVDKVPWQENNFSTVSQQPVTTDNDIISTCNHWYIFYWLWECSLVFPGQPLPPIFDIHASEHQQCHSSSVCLSRQL